MSEKLTPELLAELRRICTNTSRAILPSGDVLALLDALERAMGDAIHSKRREVALMKALDESEYP